MDEVDNIIIETLKALNCFIPEEITSLKQFEDDLVVLSVSTCLEAIVPSSKFPKKLPPSMALRLKIATHLAEQIRDIGFKDEIGYHTILYFNEVEIRRLLIFLIEKLPKDNESSTQFEEIGYAPKILSSLKEISMNYPSPKIPTTLLDRGTLIRDDNRIEVRNYGSSHKLKVKKLVIPTLTDNNALKQYYCHIVPPVTNQCAPEELIPSLMYEDCKFSRKNMSMLHYLKKIPILHAVETSEILESTSELSEAPKVENGIIKKVSQTELILNEDSKESFVEQLEEDEQKYKLLKNKVDNNKTLLQKLNKMKDEETKTLQDAQNRLKIKTKTMAILDHEENLQKLRLLVEKAQNRLVNLSEQWKNVQSPLLEEYNNLKSSVSEKELILHEKERKLKETVSNYEELLNDLKGKVELEQKLIERHQRNAKSTNRLVYTKNIMEIIGNIKKQNNEMQKILIDTKTVQRDINSLTGQIDRSFTISDELIFSNAKKDETSRSAYKLLVSLHVDCGEIVKILLDIGLIERECRNLQELYDNETTRETSVKLKRLSEDLQQVRMENMNLMKQVQ